MNDKYEDNINVDYLNGFLRALSNACGGCDYVPFYGAISFPITKEGTLESLKYFLDIKESSTKHHRQINNFRFLDQSAGSAKLDSLLTYWIDQKLFDGKFHENSTEIDAYIASYKDDLIEQIEFISESNAECFYANLEHDGFELDCEIIGYSGSQNAFFLHFSWID